MTQLHAAYSTAHAFAPTFSITTSLGSLFGSKPQHHPSFGFGMSAIRNHPFLFVGLGLGALGLAAVATWLYRKQLSQLLWGNPNNPVVFPSFKDLSVNILVPKQQATNPQPQHFSPQEPAALSIPQHTELETAMVSKDFNVNILVPKQRATNPQHQHFSPQEPAALLMPQHTELETAMVSKDFNGNILVPKQQTTNPHPQHFSPQEPGTLLIPQHPELETAMVSKDLSINIPDSKQRTTNPHPQHFSPQEPAALLMPQHTELEMAMISKDLSANIPDSKQQEHKPIKVSRELATKHSEYNVLPDHFKLSSYDEFKTEHLDETEVLMSSLAQFGLEGAALENMVQTVLADARAGKDIVLAILNDKIEDIPEYAAVQKYMSGNNFEKYGEWEVIPEYENIRWNYEQLFVKLASFLYLMSAEKRPDGTVKGFKEGTFKIADKRFKELLTLTSSFWRGANINSER